MGGMENARTPSKGREGKQGKARRREIMHAARAASNPIGRRLESGAARNRTHAVARVNKRSSNRSSFHGWQTKPKVRKHAGIVLLGHRSTPMVDGRPLQAVLLVQQSVTKRPMCGDASERTRSPV